MKTKPGIEIEPDKPSDEIHTEMGIPEERATFIMDYIESLLTNPKGFYTSNVIKAIQEEPEFDNNEKVFATYMLGVMQATHRYMESRMQQASQSPFGSVLMMPQSGNALIEFLEDISKEYGDTSEPPEGVDCDNCDRTDCKWHPSNRGKKP